MTAKKKIKDSVPLPRNSLCMRNYNEIQAYMHATCSYVHCPN